MIFYGGHLLTFEGIVGLLQAYIGQHVVTTTTSHVLRVDYPREYSVDRVLEFLEAVWQMPNERAIQEAKVCHLVMTYQNRAMLHKLLLVLLEHLSHVSYSANPGLRCGVAQEQTRVNVSSESSTSDGFNHESKAYRRQHSSGGQGQ